MRVESLMEEAPQRCMRSDTLQDVARRMWRLGCTALPLCGADGELLGQVEARSIYQRACVEGTGARVLYVRDLPADPACSCSPESEVADAWALMTVTRASRLFVVDPAGRLVGVVTHRAIVEADRGMVAKIRVRRGRPEAPAADSEDGWTLIPSHACLIAPGGEVKTIQRNLLQLLLVFLERPGSTLSRTLLLQRVCNRQWKSSDRYIDVLVGQLRRKFSESAGSQHVIRTTYGRGYTCMLEVEPTGLTSRLLLRAVDQRERTPRVHTGVPLAV